MKNSHRMNWIGLAAVLVLGTGASPEGVQQAKEWQYQGDIALALRQYDVAYQAYTKVATAFPETSHGRAATDHLRMIEEKLLSPARSPAEENRDSWKEEIVDFLTWP